jgi:hypothetical protein
LDNDGDLEILMTASDTQLLLDNKVAVGNPAFAQVTLTGTSANPIRRYVLANMDGDNDLDVVMGLFGGSGARGILRNNGTGTFTPLYYSEQTRNVGG